MQLVWELFYGYGGGDLGLFRFYSGVYILSLLGDYVLSLAIADVSLAIQTTKGVGEVFSF